MSEMSAEMRSLYLTQAPPEVLVSLQRMHSTAAQSASIHDRIHADTILTYIAELTREVMDLRNTVAMAGLEEEDSMDDEAALAEKRAVLYRISIEEADVDYNDDDYPAGVDDLDADSGSLSEDEERDRADRPR